MITHLKIGDQAPNFSGIDQNGKTIELSSFKGKKIILYFYPKDSTPGCTAEACNLRDNEELLQQKGYVTIGISADTEMSHKKFAEKYSLPFILIADTDKQILNLYGVWGLKKFMGREFEGIHRTTFIISEEGKIEFIFDKVDTKNHTDQILKQMVN